MKYKNFQIAISDRWRNVGRKIERDNALLIFLKKYLFCFLKLFKDPLNMSFSSVLYVCLCVNVCFT